ncbi:helix-turn-helix transcriptional regulator [Rossellomorea marisflavi]|uniref:helix-turn-helix transcriptional regulator n=1 Tax=Rossellomorea marisflavi TaxID=189381 RepID=UPI001EE2DB09|nr:YafY family protein [Rossellomorea marisflavi]UKS63570.1 YafY family transcriptional regulator [Rossellomorea marisflavi]
MSKIDSMLAILWMLRSGEKVTAKQISEKLEMNIRTVYRYIDTISTSGVPIISESGPNGGYTLLNHFMEAPLFFDVGEQTSLFHAAVFAEEAGYYGGEPLKRAISKLSKHSNQEQERMVNHHVTSLEVIRPLRPPSLEPFLKELEHAIAEGYSVNMVYHKSREQQKHERVVDPYKMLYWNNKWYVIGFCHHRSDLRSFRVDRIERIGLTEKTFSRPEDFSARDFFMKNLLPTINGKEGITRMVIIGNENTLNDVCQHWFLGHYVQEREPKKAMFLLETDIVHTHIPHLLLPYGKSIQIIEPVSLKKRIVEVLSEYITFHQE